MNPDDAAELHLKHDDLVQIASDCGDMDATVFLAPIARGNVQVHFPEGNPCSPKTAATPSEASPTYNAVVRIVKRVV
jgi:anaerobic selenocysteine-containing dehydrogenase